LINTSRGGIVNEESILKWVSNSSGHFYFTDVLSDENGNIEKSILIKTASTMSQIVITPHIGGMTQQGQSIAYNEIADILINEIDKT
jgi:phosphoglycerate dehydrogenase-like enzyme